MEGTDVISLNTIDTYLPGAKGLINMREDLKCVAQIKNNMFQLAPEITRYSVFYGNRDSKRKFDDKILNIIQRNKEKSLKKVKFVEPQTSVTKELHVGWKNLENGKYFFKNTGGTKRVLLDCNKKYSYDEVANLCASSMKDGFNDKYFDRSVAVLQLGNYDNSIFTNFLDENNQSCDFWNFISKIKKGNHQYRIYLFTEPKKSIIATSSSIYSNTNRIHRKETEETCRNQNKSSTVDSESKNKVVLDENKKIVSRDINRCVKSKISQKKSQSILSATENIISFIANYSNSLVNSKGISYGDGQGKMWMDQDFAPLKDMNCNVDLVEKEEIQFITGAVIGQGGFGTVMKATWRHTLVAVKTIRIIYETKYACREIGIMNKIRHPNIILIMAYAVDFSCCYIIMELFESWNMRELLFDKSIRNALQLSECMKFRIAKQVCIAMSFLHESNPPIIHKDFKPENILINKDFIVKICDLGTSRLKDMPSALLTTAGSRSRGTTLYMSPEVLIANQSGTTASDVWALGSVLTELFTEDLIWPSPYEADIKEYYSKQMLPDMSKVPSDLKSNLIKCFKYSPDKRVKSSKLLQIIEKILDPDSDSAES